MKESQLKVMYIHSVPQFGGASRSLFEMVRALKGLGVEPCFVFSEGSVSPFFNSISDLNVEVSRLTSFNNTEIGYYRRFRWLVLLREVVGLPRTYFAMKMAREKFGEVDIVHVNEVIDLPSAIIARHFFDAPIVLHLRTSFRFRKWSLRSRCIIWGIRRFAAVVVAIDENTRSTLPGDLNVEVVHNSLHIDVSPVLDVPDAGKSADDFVIGYVGNILYSKGILNLLKAINDLVLQGKTIHLEVVGGSIRKFSGFREKIVSLLGISDDASAEVSKYISDHQLERSVHLKGYQSDMRAVYKGMDILAFPSIFDSPGRPIFEAAFFGIPSIACISKPRSDTFIDIETGVSVPYGNHLALVRAITLFYEDRAEVARMGENARLLAHQNFDPEKNAEKIYLIYKKLVKGKSNAAVARAGKI
jgi:glycosyltransferase involved in cell wall biosynthesis